MSTTGKGSLAMESSGITDTNGEEVRLETDEIEQNKVRIMRAFVEREDSSSKVPIFHHLYLHSVV